MRNQSLTLNFTEIEHSEDRDRVVNDLVDSGIKVKNIGAIQNQYEEVDIYVTVPDWDAVVKFEKTDSVEFCTNWYDVTVSSDD